MAYRIEYGNGVARKMTVTQEKAGKNKAVIIMMIVLAILGCLALYRLGRDGLYEVLIPGDSTVTATAAIKFMKELNMGASVVDAFGVFCREVIAGA